MIHSFAADFTAGDIFVNPLSSLIVHQNDVPDFTALIFLEPPLNQWAAVNFIYQGEWINHPQNVYLLYYRYIHCLVGCLVHFHIEFNFMNSVLQ